MNKIDGYIAAPFTPMLENGEINLDLIPDYAAYLIQNGLDGAFVCGTSGEGSLLTREERMAVAEKWIEGSGGQLKIVVQTGGASLKDQHRLATHAEKIGAYAIAAMAPAFLRPQRNEELVAYCKSIAGAAPSLPFYYYHIPSLNFVQLSVMDLLKSANTEIPNFIGAKYAHGDMLEFEQCVQFAQGKFEMLLAKDDLLLDGLILGANSGVGGTYNHCFSLYMKIVEAYSMNKLKVCRQLQYQSKLFCDLLERYRGNTMAGKRIMKFLGMDFGPNRLPLQSISDQEEIELKRDLEAIGFFSYCNH